jgi:hypothetical protein
MEAIAMDSTGMKEVYFDKYCKSCKHSSVAEDSNPCNECLSEPTLVYSHKPLRYEESR